MRHRGPDGEGLWISDERRIGFAHRRLSIIDLSATGSQPMANSDQSLRVIFNGEIYNYRALRRRLEEQGRRFQSTSDTEILLHLYDLEGPEMVHQLRGMYAFALWDVKRAGLFIARDPLGIKPLFYADTGGTLRVASQVKALRQGSQISNDLDPAGVVGFHLLGSVPEPFTLFKDIRALPAGSTLWCDAKGAQSPKTFYHLPFQSPQRLPAESRSLAQAVRDSVEHHLESDVPVGIFLSSGIDSSVLASLCSEKARGALHSITLGFKELKGTAQDEVPLAEEVARLYGYRHHTKIISKNDFEKETPRILEAMDQPSIDGVNTYFVSQAAAEQGLKVVLSGIGGDEIFGTYPSFTQIPKLLRQLAPLRKIPFLGKGVRKLSAPWIEQLANPKYAGLLELGTRLEGAYFMRRGLFAPWELPALLGRELVREGLERLQLFHRFEETVEGIEQNYWRISALELSWYLRNQLLRDADWAGMAHSLEIRVPFVDPVFLEAAYSWIQHHGAHGKRDLVDTLQKPLPSEVLHRPKSGFSIPVYEWAAPQAKRRHEQLRCWSRQVFQAAIQPMVR